MLQTIANLPGVRVLGKNAQKKLIGGVAPSQAPCGVVLFNSAGNASNLSYSIDANGDGKTKDDAMADANKYNKDNAGGYYTARYCCDSCKNYNEVLP